MTAYVENFNEALPSEERIAEVRKQLEDAGVEYVLSCWIDLFGIPKTGFTKILVFIGRMIIIRLHHL